MFSPLSLSLCRGGSVGVCEWVCGRVWVCGCMFGHAAINILVLMFTPDGVFISPGQIPRSEVARPKGVHTLLFLFLF